MSNSKKGFWIGVAAGLSTSITCLIASDIYILHIMLLGISTNIIAHMTYVALKQRNIFFIARRIFGNFSEFNSYEWTCKLSSSRFVKNYDYCKIFCMCSIGLGVYPFFVITEFDNEKIGLALSCLNTLIASLSFIMLFEELWLPIFTKFFPFLWGLTLTLSLPVQTVFMLLHTDFAPIWFIDAVVIIPLLAILTSKRALLQIYILGAMLAVVLFMTINSSPVIQIFGFGYWSLISHVMVIAICTALFRKRDLEMCRFAGSTLVHEAKRSLSTFESAASFYEERLPILIATYSNLIPDDKKAISQNELETMRNLPVELQKLSERTRNILARIFSRVSSYSNGKHFAEIFSIKECINSAIIDPSIEAKIRNMINLKCDSDFKVMGDREQLMQVFINLLENACHALASTIDPQIEIKVADNSLWISDNGEGIHEVDIPNIFDEFFSTKSSSGQGLAFCKRVMSEYSGTIRCKSDKGRFTTFELRFSPIDERSFYDKGTRVSYPNKRCFN